MFNTLLECPSRVVFKQDASEKTFAETIAIVERIIRFKIFTRSIHGNTFIKFNYAARFRRMFVQKDLIWVIILLCIVFRPAGLHALLCK